MSKEKCMLKKCNNCKYYFQHFKFSGSYFSEVGCGHCVKVAKLNRVKECNFYEEEADGRLNEYVDLFKLIDKLIKQYESNKCYIDKIIKKIDNIDKKKFS